jgi:hypothetical protein
MAREIFKNIEWYKSAGDVEVVVDLADIARRYGWKAMTNKSGKSTYMDGAVVITALTKREKGETK